MILHPNDVYVHFMTYLNINKELRRMKTCNAWNPCNANRNQPDNATPGISIIIYLIN